VLAPTAQQFGFDYFCLDFRGEHVSECVLLHIIVLKRQHQCAVSRNYCLELACWCAAALKSSLASLVYFWVRRLPMFCNFICFCLFFFFQVIKRSVLTKFSAENLTCCGK